MNKISLIGAGNIGTILAYSIARKNLGDIVLVDVVDGLAEGKCLDLGRQSVFSAFRKTDCQIVELSERIVIVCK